MVVHPIIPAAISARVGTNAAVRHGAVSDASRYSVLTTRAGDCCSASTLALPDSPTNWALGEFRAGLEMGEWLSERTLRPRWNVVKGMIAPWLGTCRRQRSQVRHHRLRLRRAESWGEYRRKHGQRFRASIIRTNSVESRWSSCRSVWLASRWWRSCGSTIPYREVTVNRTVGNVVCLLLH